MITLAQIAEIEVALDDTVPYYVPRLLADMKQAIETLQYAASCDCPDRESCREWPDGQCGSCRARAVLAEESR